MRSCKKLFQEGKEYGYYHKAEGCDVVPLNGLAFEQQGADDREYSKGNHFLNDFELDKTERPAVDVRANPVGRYHKAVFEQGYSPGTYYYQNQRPVVGDVKFGKLELAIPGERHKDIRNDQKKNRPESVDIHCPLLFDCAKINYYFCSVNIY